MKVTTDTNKEFQPITLNITLESENEVEALFAIFNYAPIASFGEEHGLNSEAIRNMLEAECDGTYDAGVFDKLRKKFDK